MECQYECQILICFMYIDSTYLYWYIYIYIYIIFFNIFIIFCINIYVYLYILIYLHIFMFFISNEVTSLILCPFSGTHGFHHAMHLRRFFEPKNQVPTSAELLRLQRRVRRGWEMLWGQTTWIDWLILAFGNVRVLGDFWKVLVFWWCVFSRICFKKLLP